MPRLQTTLYDEDGLPLSRVAHVAVRAPDGSTKLCISAAHASLYLERCGVAISKSDVYNILKSQRCKKSAERLAAGGYAVAAVDRTSEPPPL